MKEKYINIIVVGYGGKRAKSFKINTRFLKGSLIAGAVSLSLILSFSVFSFFNNFTLRTKLAKVEEERDKLKSLLAHERRQNEYMREYQAKVEILESKLQTIDRFLRRKGIRRVPSGVGGASVKLDILDTEYIDFLHKEADKLRKSLSRIPLGPPTWGRITSRYGYRRDPFNGKYEFHEGVDIKAPYGTRVRATADGKVIFAGWKPGYGKTVIIKHAYGYRTLYGHMSRIRVKAGQWVKSGDVIGYVGSTGRSTGPHVHYEVWHNSRLQNPLKYMYVRW